MPPLKVAIIGAGPVGCILARLLFRGGVDVIVFEGEASFNFRDQGGTLDLHTTTGLLAMKEADLWQEFLEHARYEGQSMVIADKHCKAYLKRAPSGAADKLEERPEIDRVTLRRILLESLPADMIKWGHRLAEVDDNKVLHFMDGTTADGFDLIVGADGAWSKVRDFLDPHLKPQFAQVGMFAFKTENLKDTIPDAYRFVNHGSVFSHADGIRTSMQELGDGGLSMSVAFVTDSDKWMDPAWTLEEAQQEALKKLDGWASVYTEGIAKSESFMARSLYQLPVGSSWVHREGVTLAGDSAHLMTPFAGEGVNIGMEDARILATRILDVTKGDSNMTTLNEQVQVYEKLVCQGQNDTETDR
ncbi:unnamed protein product [Parascedosporium putredinis]|uniref:FAD-binding domain-containing protein n=1 Tax=Parascedosporium putredinis TaxID=1442378 RepID=A0A9P1GWV0_9PEZI|nr:unnamed protein product [Parascedosporium putredinis]CAI7989177.1 unnamed protein product [Parascedosporium putredinis]